MKRKTKSKLTKKATTATRSLTLPPAPGTVSNPTPYDPDNPPKQLA